VSIKVGQEYVARCPFHDDKHPSLSVSEDKGLFHCFGCGVGGDPIRFVELAEKVSFKDALSILGIGDELQYRLSITQAQRKAASIAATWMAEQRRKIKVLLGEKLERIELADEIGDGELAESFLREQSFLRDLYDYLDIPRYASDFLSLKGSIEQITKGVCS
jgi:hypothetical protein